MTEELLGPIADGWRYLTLGEVCRLGGGDIQTGPFGSQLHASDYVADGIPSIMPVNIGDNRISDEKIARVSEDDAERLKRYRVQVGDIIYSRRGDVERRSLIREREDGWLCGTGCLRVRIGRAIADPEFTAQYLGHPAVREWIVRHAHGATMPNLNTSILAACPFVLPPMREQEAIASALGALDDKIELNRRMNETLEETARAIFKDWFVDFGPTRAKIEDRAPYLAQDIWSLFPDRLDDEGRPEGWQARSIYEIADVVYGAPFSSKLFNIERRGRPLIRIRDLPNETPGVWTPEEHPKGYMVRAGDIVVGMDGEFRAYLWGGDDAWLNQRVCVFKPKVGFSAAFVRNSIYEPLAEVEATEIATTVIHLGKNDIDRFAVIMPREKLVEKFNGLSQPLYDRIVTNKRDSRTLATTRDLLLPKLMSGEVRVKDAEKLVGEAT